MQENVVQHPVRLDVPANENLPLKQLAAPARLSLPHSSTLLAVLAITVCSLLIALAWFAPSAQVQQAIADLRNSASRRSAEYLFFIGTTHLSLLLLRQKKWIKAKLMFLLGVAWVVLHEPVSEFVRNLGGDSFAEAQAFDMNEAVFWLQTLQEAIRPRFSWPAMLCYLVAAVASYQALRVLLRRRAITTRHYSYIKFSIAAVVIGIAVKQTVSEPIALFIENTQTYAETKANFSNPAPLLLADGGGIDVLVYIGESTSVMNMGIYGYPRNTTPALQKLKDTDDGLLVFRNVFSTHTHTSPSLLEALSFGIDDRQRFLTINKRKRLSLMDLLESNHVRTTLISNQGQTGTWNMASSIIFNRSRSIYSSDTRKLGNNDDKIRKPWDDAYFSEKIGAAFGDRGAPSQLVFLHSYSGHGGYFDNIPPAYRKPVDARFATPPNGAAIPFRDRVEAYDAAIRYIDQSVSRAIAYVRASQRPIVFVYFSDHGDAPYAGRAHDSSQFIHEMARVPFLLYFNPAARRLRPDAYDRYRALAGTSHDATLAQLPSTLLDLMNRQVAPAARRMLLETPVIGEQAQHPPIVVRETAAGLSFVDINPHRMQAGSAAVPRMLDGSDPASRTYAAMRNKSNSASRVCYRGVDSIGKLMRSRLVADCVEVAVVVNNDGTVSVAGLAGQDSGLTLKDVFEVTARNKMGVWIHAPGLRARAPCETLARYLRDHAAPGNPVLVEFPAGSHLHAAELAGCAAHLAGTGAATSYAVASADALSCSKSLAEGRAFGSKRSCVRLQNDVAAAWRSRLFTDIGFDHDGMPAMEALREAGHFRWNTWHVKPEAYSGATSERLQMTILATDNE